MKRLLLLFFWATSTLVWPATEKFPIVLQGSATAYAKPTPEDLLRIEKLNLNPDASSNFVNSRAFQLSPSFNSVLLTFNFSWFQGFETGHLANFDHEGRLLGSLLLTKNEHVDFPYRSVAQIFPDQTLYYIFKDEASKFKIDNDGKFKEILRIQLNSKEKMAQFAKEFEGLKILDLQLPCSFEADVPVVEEFLGSFPLIEVLEIKDRENKLVNPALIPIICKTNPAIQKIAVDSEITEDLVRSLLKSCRKLREIRVYIVGDQSPRLKKLRTKFRQIKIERLIPPESGNF